MKIKIRDITMLQWLQINIYYCGIHRNKCDQCPLYINKPSLCISDSDLLSFLVESMDIEVDLDNEAFEVEI